MDFELITLMLLIFLSSSSAYIWACARFIVSFPQLPIIMAVGLVSVLHNQNLFVAELGLMYV